MRGQERIPLHDHVDGNSGGPINRTQISQALPAASGLGSTSGISAHVVEGPYHTTGETSTALVLRPDGSGGVEWGSVPGGLPWFMPEDYGAAGDGTTDDSAAFGDTVAAYEAAGGGVLYLPNKYLVGTGYGLTQPGMVLGGGRGSPTGASTHSELVYSHATATMLEIQDHVHVRNLQARNSHATPTAGAIIAVSSTGDAISMKGCLFRGGWIGLDWQEGGGWALHDNWFTGPRKYGVKIRNVSSPDGGDQSIVGCWFYAYDSATPDAAIYQESAGGTKVINCKINSLNASGNFVRGIDVAPSSTTTILLVQGNSIENVSGDAIHVATSGSGWDMIGIIGNQVGNYSNTTGNAVEITCANLGEVEHVVIANNILHQAGGGTPAAINLTKVNDAFIGGNVYSGWGSHLTTSGCTNIVNLDLLGATPSGELGGTWDAITVDSTHAGSAHIALSSATPLVESGAGSAGSGTAASKDDHVHPAAASAGGQHILLADGHATPFTFNDLLQMDDGSDFMWSDA